MGIPGFQGLSEFYSMNTERKESQPRTQPGAWAQPRAQQAEGEELNQELNRPKLLRIKGG